MEQAGAEGRSALFAGEASSTLALVIYLALAILLMLADRRGDYLQQFRDGVAQLSEPLYTLAELPALVFDALRQGLAQRAALQSENQQLAQALRESRLRLAEAELALAEQRRLAGGLALARREQLVAVPARVLDVDPDPFRHRVVIDRGSSHGVAEGSALIDAAGVVGQLIERGRQHSVVLLISDPGHGLPVVNARSGERSLLYGIGEHDRLLLRSMPLTADMQAGDLLLSSGLGGRFPAGLPVARVQAVERSAGASHASALATPLAALRQVRELLVVQPASAGEGPPLPQTGAAELPAGAAVATGAAASVDGAAAQGPDAATLPADPAAADAAADPAPAPAAVPASDDGGAGT